MCSISVVIDVTPPESGFVVDGSLDNFADLEFSSFKSTVELQWHGFSDPESRIKEYDIKIMKRGYVFIFDEEFILRER